MTIDTIEKLEALYGTPAPASLVKVAKRITPQYRAWIEASPFCALATVGPEGSDCTPRGDAGQVAYVENDSTVALPDRRGNNRIDTLRNIVADGRVSLMFMVPGSNNVIRLNGTARVTLDDTLRARFAFRGKPPRSVVVIRVDEVYSQCARALMRAGLWTADPVSGLPTAGDLLAEQTDGQEGGADYDAAWGERAARTMW